MPGGSIPKHMSTFPSIGPRDDGRGDIGGMASWRRFSSERLLILIETERMM